MPCGTLIGNQDPIFGIPLAEDFSALVQSIKYTAKADKKEIRNSCGNVAALVFSKKMCEVEVQFYGKPGEDQDLTEVLTLANGGPAAGEAPSAFFIEEISAEHSNTDAVKTTNKAVSYDGLVVAP